MSNTLNELRDALDATYPFPDSPHESVKQRARESRAAFIQGWQQKQAATEAAKATGTAGELPLINFDNEKFHALLSKVRTLDFSGASAAAEQLVTLVKDSLSEYGQACAEAVLCAPDGESWQHKFEETDRALLYWKAKAKQAEVARQPAPVVAMQHPDDIAVDKFAVAMKDKMAVSRTKGRGGWENPEECGIEDLACMLVQHVEKGDPVDIGNFCMMVWNRVSDTGPDTYAPIVEAFLSYAGDAAKPAPATLPPVVGVSRDADSPGMTGVLVTFARLLSDGQLRELHEYLNRSQP